MSNFGNSTAFLEILMGKDASLEASIKIKKGKDEKAKIKLFVEIYKSKLANVYFVVPQKKLNNIISSEIVDRILDQLIHPQKIVALETLYKTMVANYQDFDRTPFGVLRSNSVSEEEVKGLSSGDLRYT